MVRIDRRGVPVVLLFVLMVLLVFRHIITTRQEEFRKGNEEAVRNCKILYYLCLNKTVASEL